MADTIQDTNQVIAAECMFRMDRDRFVRAVVDDTQALQRPTAGHSIKYEIHRPDLVGRRWTDQWLTFRYRYLFPSSALNL